MKNYMLELVTTSTSPNSMRILFDTLNSLKETCDGLQKSELLRVRVYNKDMDILFNTGTYESDNDELLNTWTYDEIGLTKFLK